ncbi:MAG: hypothetical protein ACOVLE_05795, partial [Pirellula staleyi]
MTTLIAAPVLARQEPASFHRAINLNGPALTIDGHPWESGTADDLKTTSKSFENQNVPLKPSTDPSRAKMIRSSRWGQPVELTVTNLPEGRYQVFVYVWEDNASERFSIQLNGKTVL